MDELGDIRNKCDNYRQTVEALVAFVHTARWNHENDQPLTSCKFSFGRRLNTSSQNKVSPNIVVTPDMAVERTASNGIVLEIKKSLPENRKIDDHRELWDDHILKRLKKYDDDLVGWFTEDEVDSLNVIFLTDLTLCVKVKEFLEAKREDGKFQPVKEFALIGFERSSNNEECITFKLEDGELTDKHFERKLQLVDKVSLEKAKEGLGGFEYKFYDGEPPVPLLAHDIWMNVLLKNVEHAQKNPKYDCKTIEITLEVVVKQLQKCYGSTGSSHREQEFPQKKWVKKSFVFLKKIGYVKSSDEGPETYTCLLKKIRQKDVQEYFCRKWLEVQSKAPARKKSAQPSLFEKET